jgi:enamine deaminase RidA (YjgF/YER057c/UK114 family)
MTHTGQVGAEQTVETAQEAARVCTLNALANIKAALGSLDRVEQFLFVSGYVNGVNGFAESPAVINGASNLLVEIFGEAGKHARAAVAVCGLPLESTVELQITVEVKP